MLLLSFGFFFLLDRDLVVHIDPPSEQFMLVCTLLSLCWIKDSSISRSKHNESLFIILTLSEAWWNSHQIELMLRLNSFSQAFKRHFLRGRLLLAAISIGRSDNIWEVEDFFCDLTNLRSLNQLLIDHIHLHRATSVLLVLGSVETIPMHASLGADTLIKVREVDAVHGVLVKDSLQIGQQSCIAYVWHSYARHFKTGIAGIAVRESTFSLLLRSLLAIFEQLVHRLCKTGRHQFGTYWEF